jgi:hypothetical protein
MQFSWRRFAGPPATADFTRHNSCRLPAERPCSGPGLHGAKRPDAAPPSRAKSAAPEESRRTFIERRHQAQARRMPVENGPYRRIADHQSARTAASRDRSPLAAAAGSEGLSRQADDRRQANHRKAVVALIAGQLRMMQDCGVAGASRAVLHPALAGNPTDGPSGAMIDECFRILFPRPASPVVQSRMGKRGRSADGNGDSSRRSAVAVSS